MNYTLTKEQVRHIFELGFIHGATDVGRGELDKYLKYTQEKEGDEEIENLDYSIGETFLYKGLNLICEQGETCEGCHFDDGHSSSDCSAEELDCAFPSRIFKLIKEDE